jgi:hypothetical protein
MKNFLKVLTLLALILGAPAAARADVEDGTVISDRVVAPLMAWVEREVGVKVPGLPQVVASRAAFRSVLGRMNGGFAGRPRSLYMGGRVILDSELWDEEDDMELSLLVHELVHYAQSYMHVAWNCPNQREVMAYSLQNKWLEEHDHRPFVRASWIARVSSCGDSSTRMALAQSPDD